MNFKKAGKFDTLTTISDKRFRKRSLKSDLNKA